MEINLDEDGYTVNFTEDVLNVKVTELATVSNPNGVVGDMNKVDYDPQLIEGDTFARENHTGTQGPNTIVQDENNRFTTDAEKTNWNGKRDKTDNVFGTVDNNTEFESDGTMVMKGSATVFNDMSASLIGKRLSAVQGTVAYNYTENSIDFSSGGSITNLDDCVVFNYQMPHSAKPNSSINLHMHYERSSTNVYQITIWHRIQSAGQPKNTTWAPTIVSSSVGDRFPYVSGTLNQIMRLIDIDMSGAGLSAQIEFRLTRTDNNAGILRATFVDAHYETDAIGSHEQYVK